jgi:DNA topoisomerase-2
MSLSNEEQELTNKYQKKSAKQHVLDNPDTYIGSVEKIESFNWVLNESGDRIVERNITVVPGLIKLFDEGIVNCRDHVERQSLASKNGVPNTLPVTYIDISIQDDGTICMTNDGNGIDVAEHPEYKIWIPELIFGHLRTSTNYDKTEKKIVGGKNGFGFKLVLIWSTEGSIETVDHVRGLKYKQDFTQNLDVIGKPVITKCSKTKPYTKITFKPDYVRLGMEEGLTPDLIALLRRRVYDIAAITDKNVKVKYNSVLTPIKNFQQYIDFYIGTKDVVQRAYEEGGERWEYAVAISPTHEFIQVSFVNGIHTAKGGKHVEYILNQITRKLCAFIEKKKKVTVNPNSIKEQLFLFLRCDIENPSFDSQTKDFMNTPSSKFGSSCTVSDKFIEKLAKMGVMDAACAITELKETKVAKKTDGVKSKNIRGIPKLIDANWAGTDKSNLCTIIFCEGDSAKAGIVSGLSSEDRNIIGVYPMKGKIMNVRGETTKKIAENKEIADFKKILGLETGKEYKTMEDVKKHLRYSCISFMTDQDLDGSHIKGLGINLIQSEWPSLCQIPGFIQFMNTPILKARKGHKELVFYNDGEYESWKTANPQEVDSWKIKYYKGLGTSTGKEFREYFEQKKMVGFVHTGKESDDAIDKVFNKKKADDRKEWLEDYDRNRFLDTSKPTVTYEEFISSEFIHFSKYDCDRSIPNLMDGNKTSQRKVIYAAFKKNLTTEIKVAQFTGYTSEHSGYHHGEASLNGTIVGMAQNFVGSNNINLLMPNGQFGTRLQGGKDSASERYIFTQLSKITRHIFPETDDAILEYLDDDGQIVEPRFYAGVLPMVVVNGAKGIGTGFSTEIPCYNPLDIISYLKSKLEGEKQPSFQEFVPYYEGFKGTIKKIGETNRFLVKGKYENLGGDKIRVTELPVGLWTDDFKEYLEQLAETTDKNGKKVIPIVKDYDDMCKDTTVDFVITLAKGKVQELESIVLENGLNGLQKQFKLFSTISTNNMHLFDANDKLKKYASVPEIIDDYFGTRLHLYHKRKQHQIDAISKLLLVLSNKCRYIEENLEGTIDLRRKKKEEVVDLLTKKAYDLVEGDTEFKYLTKLPMDSVTDENVERLKKEHSLKSVELEEIKAKSEETMWMEELIALEKEYDKFREERERAMSGNEKKVKKTKDKKVKKFIVVDEED